MGEYRIYLTDILYVLRKNFKYIIQLGIVGLILGVMIFFAQKMLTTNTITYKTSVSYYVTADVENSRYANGGNNINLADVNMINTLMESVVYFCRSTALTKPIVDELGLTGLEGNKIGRALSVSRYGTTQILQVSLQWPDREEGEKIVDAITRMLPELLKKTMKTGGIELVDLPSTKTIEKDTSPKVVLLIAALGVMLGLAICMMPLFVRPTIISLNRVEEMIGIPRLGDLPEVPIAGRIDTPELQNSIFRDSFLSSAHMIMHQIRSRKANCSSIYFTSAQTGEGTTTVVGNLGLALSAIGIKTLLLDLSVDQPKLSSTFAEHSDFRKSLNAVYFMESDIQDAVIQVNERLDILPTLVDVNEIGINNRLGEVVKQLSAMYDLILIDSASIGQSSDTLSLNAIADAIIFVTRFDCAPVSVLKYNIEKLHKTGAPILGCVVNAIPEVSFTNVGMTAKSDDSALKSAKKHLAVKQLGREPKEQPAKLKTNADSDERFKRVMSAINSMDSNIKENMMLEMLENLEGILDNHSISLYTVEPGMRYARLALCSKEIINTASRSILLETYKDILQIVGKHKIFSNSDINNGLPMYAAGIMGDKQIDILIMIHAVTASQFNGEYQEMIQMSCDILQMLYQQMCKRESMNRQYDYEPDTGIMEAVRFRQMVEGYEKIREKQVAQFTLVRLDNVNKWNISQQLRGHIRTSDALGYDEKGRIYLLLTQITRDNIDIVLKRLEAAGIENPVIVDALPSAYGAYSGLNRMESKEAIKVTETEIEKSNATGSRQFSGSLKGNNGFMNRKNADEPKNTPENTEAKS